MKERALSFLKDKEAALHQMEAELKQVRRLSKIDQGNMSDRVDTDVDVEQTTQSGSDIV